MTTTARELGFTQEAFEWLLESRNEPAWMKALRTAAWKTFNEMPWPARNDEEWIRTDIRLFKLDRFALAAEPKIGAACSRGLLGARIELAGQTLAVDGHRGAETHVSGRWRPTLGHLCAALLVRTIGRERLRRSSRSQRALRPRLGRGRLLRRHATVARRVSR